MHEDDGMMGQFIVKPNPTSTSEIMLNNSIINIYPNPAKNSLTVSINGNDSFTPFEIKVYDLIGKLIYSETAGKSRTVINSSNWNSGLYSIIIKQGKNSIHKKTIIE